jgi:hypothetical protein
MTWVAIYSSSLIFLKSFIRKTDGLKFASKSFGIFGMTTHLVSLVKGCFSPDWPILRYHDTIFIITVNMNYIRYSYMMKEIWDEAALSRKFANEDPLHVRSKCMKKFPIICENKAVMDHLDPKSLKCFKERYCIFSLNICRKHLSDYVLHRDYFLRYMDFFSVWK